MPVIDPQCSFLTELGWFGTATRELRIADGNLKFREIRDLSGLRMGNKGIKEKYEIWAVRMRNKGINGNKKFLHTGIKEICYEIFGFGIRELRK